MSAPTASTWPLTKKAKSDRDPSDSGFSTAQLSIVPTNDSLKEDEGQQSRLPAERSAAQYQEPPPDFGAPGTKQVMGVLMRAARTNATILISGESGTGKSLVARAVHANSHLADQPFVTVNCPSLARDLLESNLFGHARGAFTGAVSEHWGKVRAAEGGTLFLDEIGDLPLEIQPKLLRLLQERAYERLGENVTRTANLRVIAATNRDLKERMRNGQFREDLYFRLNVIAVEMPPLRECPGDLTRFAEHYFQHFSRQSAGNARTISPAALACIHAYGWPGNLRELRNTLERSVILTEGDQIQPSDLALDLLLPEGRRDSTRTIPEPNPQITLAELEELHLRQVLAQTSSLAEAAEVLGIDRVTLYRKRKLMTSR